MKVKFFQIIFSLDQKQCPFYQHIRMSSESILTSLFLSSTVTIVSFLANIFEKYLFYYPFDKKLFLK